MPRIRQLQSGRWQADVRKKNINKSATFIKKSDAVQWAHHLELQIERDTYIDTDESKVTSLSTLISRYIEDAVPLLSPSSKPKTISRLRIIDELLGKQIISKITTSDILKYQNTRLKSVKPGTVAREITTILRLLSFANNDCKIKLPHGIPTIDKLEYDDSRSRRVSDTEIQAILESTSSIELPYIIKLALETASRRGELANLLRRDVDLKNTSMTLRETKNGKNRIVPLSSRAIKVFNEIFKQLPSRLDGRVFGMTDEAISKAFSRAVKRARSAYSGEDESFLDDLRLHDLRHEATSRLAQLLPNVIELSRVTGHRDLKMLSRYYQISVSDLAKKLA